jgi:ABC-2 type transport system permease protein
VSVLPDALHDSSVIFKRNLIKMARLPEVLVFAMIQPIMFVLLFAYVFGSAIDLKGTNYREFLIAGIFAQTILFGATFTGMGVAEDMQKGVMDRFRSLPMSRSAVLVGRTLSDVAINSLSIVVMGLTGLLVGWHIRTSFLEALAGVALLLLFGYAFSWIMAYVALLAPSQESVQNISFLVIFPVTFVANTFVPLENLPRVLKVMAEWNPVSTVTQASRELFGNTAGVVSPSTAWPIEHAALYTLGWSFLLLAVFVPLSVRLFKTASVK